jgi:hypothetical protein
MVHRAEDEAEEAGGEGEDAEVAEGEVGGRAEVVGSRRHATGLSGGLEASKRQTV